MQNTTIDQLVNLKFINAFVSAFRVLEAGRAFASGNAFYRIFERYLTKALQEYAETFQDQIPPNIRERWLFMFEQHSAVNEILKDKDIKEINRIQPELKKIEDILLDITDGYDKGRNVSNFAVSPSKNVKERGFPRAGSGYKKTPKSAKNKGRNTGSSKSKVYGAFDEGLPALNDKKYESFTNHKDKRNKRGPETDSKLDSQVYNPYKLGNGNHRDDRERGVYFVKELGNEPIDLKNMQTSMNVDVYAGKRQRVEPTRAEPVHGSLHLEKKVKTQNFVVSSLAMKNDNEGLICGSSHFLLFSIPDKEGNTANVVKIAPPRKKQCTYPVLTLSLAYYTGSVYLSKWGQYIAHDNTFNQLVKISKKNKSHKSEVIVKNLNPVTITASSLKKHQNEDVIFLNQTNCILACAVEDPQYLQFKVAFTPNGEISDFELTDDNQLVTLTYLGVLSLYEYDLRSEESAILAQFQIESERPISKDDPMDEQLDVNYHMMSYSPSSRVLLVAGRNESKLIHHEFQFFQIQGPKDNPRLVLKTVTSRFAEPKKSYFRVLGYFGLFESNPVFFAIELKGNNTKLHSVIYNVSDGTIDVFKKSMYIELGLCECVCYGREFYWAIDENGSTARIGLNYC